MRGGRWTRGRTASSSPTTAGVSSTASRATLRVLPEVVAAVGDRTEVLFDGGIRRGSDIVKALALGARAVLVGRAYVYGLGAGGGPGVTRAIEILRADLLRTLRLLGCALDGRTGSDRFSSCLAAGRRSAVIGSAGR